MSNDLYAPLRAILDAAYDQAAAGKGKARHAADHAGNVLAWADQPIMTLGRQCGPGGTAFQAMKKAGEAVGMHRRGERDAAVKELLGTIVYAAATIYLIQSETGEEPKSPRKFWTMEYPEPVDLDGLNGIISEQPSGEPLAVMSDQEPHIEWVVVDRNDVGVAIGYFSTEAEAKAWCTRLGGASAPECTAVAALKEAAAMAPADPTPRKTIAGGGTAEISEGDVVRVRSLPGEHEVKPHYWIDHGGEVKSVNKQGCAADRAYDAVEIIRHNPKRHTVEDPLYGPTVAGGGTLKLREGAWGRTRAGGIVGPIRWRNAVSDWPWVAGHHGPLFTGEGFCGFIKSPLELEANRKPNDIVELIPPEQIP